MMKKILARSGFVLLISLLVPAKVNAGVIPGVSILNFYSEYVSGADQRRATNIINGNGYFGDYHSALPVGNSWLTLAAVNGDYTNSYVTFDLGAVYNIDRMKVWNYNEANLTTRGVQRADISYSTDGVNFTTNSPGVVFSRAPGVYSNISQTISLASIPARYVTIKVVTNYGEAMRAGLAEVRFIDNGLPPTIVDATRSYLGTNVVVRFGETVLSTDATNAANYHLLVDGTNAATVLSVAFGSYNDTVVLKTTPLNSNLLYSVSATNIHDAANISLMTNGLVTVDPQVVLWLKADAGVTTDGSGNVTQWNDQSGLNNHATPGANPMPTLVPNVVNGNPAVHFDGSAGQLLEIADSASVDIRRDLTLYLVMSTDTSATPIHGPISKCLVNQPASFDLQLAVTTGRATLVRGNGNNSQGVASTGAGLAPNQFYVVTAVMRGSNITHYLNGNFNTSGNSLAGFGNAGTPIRLGVRADGVTRLRGNLAEVMVIRGAVSDGDQAALDSYLGGKYGISIVPLAIVSQPQSTSRLVGETATFGVSAVAGAPNIFYQWQSNTVNILNATNPIYTTAPLTLAANGSLYRAVVRTSLGITNISNPATLTVTADNQPPTLYSATRKTGSATDVVVVFSEIVATASATNLANYALDNGVSILAATVGTTSNQVILTTSGLNAGTTYKLSVQNVQDVFGNIMLPGTAQILPANMVFWTRADSGVRSDGSGFVTDWNDQTANQNHAQQYFGLPAEPTLVPNAMNGLPAIRFDGATNFLQAASSPTLAITNDMTVYVAINFADYAAGRQILGKTLINQPASYDYYILNSTTTRFLRGNGSASVAIAATTTPSAGATHVMGVTMQGTAVTHFLDGLANGGGTLSTAMTDAGTPFRIGSRHDLLQYMKGDIAEIMIFNSALSANDRLIVNNYLGVKYLPFTFTLQPTNDTKLEGQTATFYVGASQGGAAFNYQWLRYGTNVVGATNAAYTTPILTLADDQFTYTALVWVSGGPTNVSSTATLTVLPDTALPTVVAAGRKLWSQTEIVVLFSEGVTPITATNTGNYQLDNGALVNSAAMGDASNKVVLATTVTNGGTYLLTVQNVKDFFNNTMIATQVPVTYYPFPILWVKGDAGITADGSGFVSQWDDQSGYGNNLLQSFGPPFAPVVITNGFNGMTSLHFASGQTNYLLTAAPSAASLSCLDAMSIYTVARFDDSLSFNGLIEKTTGNQPSPWDYYLLSGSGVPRFLRGDALASQSVTGVSAPSLGTPHIVSVILQSPVFMLGSSVTHYLDGTANGTGTINTPVNDLGDPVSVGSRGNLGTAMHGDFAEILLFNSVLSTTDRQSLDLYLGNKYAILLGPVPKISFGPAVGGILPLSWPTPNLTYVLESTPSLSSPAWTPVPNTVTTANGTNTVSINTTNDLQFFRLHKQ